MRNFLKGFQEASASVIEQQCILDLNKRNLNLNNVDHLTIVNLSLSFRWLGLAQWVLRASLGAQHKHQNNTKT